RDPERMRCRDRPSDRSGSRTDPWRGLGKTACRARGAREHDQRRGLVGSAGLRENLFPLDFRASEHGRYEFTHLLGRSIRLGMAGRRLRLLMQAAQARQNFSPTDQVERIDAQRPAYETEQDDSANTDAAGATHRKAARSFPAPIFYLVAARQFIQAHDLPLSRFLHGLHLNSDSSTNVGSRPLGVSLSTRPGRT